MHLLNDEPERRHRARVLTAAGLCALSLVGGGLAGAASIELPPVKSSRVSMRVVHIAQPKPETRPEPEPTPEPTPPPKAPPVVEPPRHARPTRMQPSAPEAPVAQAQTPAVAAAPAPVRLGLSLSSMGQGSGGPAFAVGDPVAGVPGGRAPAKAAAASVPMPMPTPPSGARVHREAELQARVAPDYPHAARREGIEGVVVIALTITDRGEVEEARLLRGLGHGLDDAALTASRKTRWSPATIDGRPVRSQRRFNVRFTLDS